MFDSLLFMGATNFCLLISSAPSFNQSRCLILLVAEVFVFLAQAAFSLIGSSKNKLWMFQVNSINSDLFIQVFFYFLSCVLLDVVSEITWIITISNFRESLTFNFVNFFLSVSSHSFDFKFEMYFLFYELLS